MSNYTLDELRESMVKILDSNGGTVGSGFIIRADGYLVTCHHVIYLLDALRVEYQGQVYAAEWCKEFSNLEVDIAILKIDVESAKAVPLINPKHLSTSVKVFGFPPAKKANFPEGFDVFAQSIRASAPLNVASTYTIKNQNGIKFNNPWNKLPPENSTFLSHQLDAKVESGSSGGAVLAEELGGVVGVIQCSKSDASYVIRWDNLLDSLDKLELEPEKNAVCNFLADIEEYFKDIKLFHTKEKIILKEQYIPIQVTLERKYKHEIETSWAYTEGEAEFKRLYAMKGFDEELQKRKEEETKRVVVDWEEAKKENQKIMVLADPGMGKSTLLRMETGLIAREEREKLRNLSPNPSPTRVGEQDTPLLTRGGGWGVRSKLGVNDVIFPLFLRLSDLAEAEGEIIDAIPRIIERDYPKTAKSIKDLLGEKLKNGKCLLLLDALDEVPQQYRLRLKERLNRFLKNYNCSIICTSRIVGYGGAFVDSAKEVEIVPFSQKQTEAYIQIWFKNAAGYIEDDSVSAEGLIVEIQKKPQIAGLAQNPLLLSLLCSLYQTKGLTLPARRAQVYKKAVDYMLSQWRDDNNRLSPENVIAKKKLLADLAYKFSSEGKEVFSRNELHKVIEESLNKQEIRDFRNQTTEELIKELSEADGIIQKLARKGEQYLFLHRTFQEYFTAYYLNETIENDKTDGIALAKKLFWGYDSHETLTLLASLMKNPMLLIEALFKEKDDIFRTLLLLAGRCIVEVQQNGEASGGISQKPKLIAEIINKIYKFWRRYPKAIFIESVVVALGKVNSQMSQKLIAALKDSESYVRYYAAEALGKIGNAEAVPELIAALKDSESDVRRYAASALGNIGAEAVPELIAALKDSESDVRRYVAEVLGKIGNAEAVPELIAALKDSESDVRRYAAEVLGKIGNAEAVPELIAALKDSESYVRYYAASALGKIGNAEAVPELIAALKDSESYVRCYAAEALGKIGNAEALNKIIYLSEIDIYEGEIFTSARTLAVRYSKQKLSFIPVYPELVRFNRILTFVKRRLQSLA
ncbi:HEAT repeat domain-containing protein [Nostoc foliaceum]|uniref:HEAT repeat domain-containing protein n=1 Tax=Nostoc foliaceum FACHB-393 TaxID=2692915 RepID=A0ABR8IB86_9NOSO|nr:HEAT repeat domain-containing protein [Nostoc foliaceum]MBD2648785.1 HEAT repeat domain-containing protein [Nostoc foliaceum FACHB-393]